MTHLIPDSVQALIFDCDGTLADTMPLHYQAWLKILGRAGIPFPETRFYQLGGMPTEKIIKLLSEESGVPVTDIPAMTLEKESIYLTLLHEVQPIEPTVRVAEQYRGKLPMAVASGGYREVIGRTLRQIRVADWFQTVVCAEDTVLHKPEPDVFLEAARRLGVREARHCVVFEDTDLGMEAARRAGMIGIDIRPWR
jgi:HAD superfamily hydrolase (TIGR01509 family)